MPVPALIAAGGGIAAGIASGIFGSNQASKNRAFQERMQREAWSRDDSAMQRHVKDLKASGLNPMLAANGGAAMQSSAPSGSPTPSLDTSSIASGLGKAASAIQASEMMKMQKDMNVAQINKLEADTNLANHNAALSDAQILDLTNRGQLAGEANTRAWELHTSQLGLNSQQLQNLKAAKINVFADTVLKNAQASLTDQSAANLKETLRSITAQAGMDEVKFNELLAQVEQKLFSGAYKGRDLSSSQWYKNLQSILQLLGAPLRGIINVDAN